MRLLVSHWLAISVIVVSLDFVHIPIAVLHIVVVILLLSANFSNRSVIVLVLPCLNFSFLGYCSRLFRIAPMAPTAVIINL